MFDVIALRSFSCCFFAAVFSFFRLHCYANIGQQRSLFIADGTDERLPDVVHSAANISLLSCGVKCTRCTDCLSISYQRQARTCELSSSPGNEGGMARISAPGWTVYRQTNYACPHSASGFIQVGSMTIKLCPGPATWQEATNACSLFGRLVRIDTLAKMGAIIDYLADYPNDVWINGYRTSYMANTWLFDDGTPMPAHGTPDFWASTDNVLDEECVRLKRYDGFKMNDIACGDMFSYICEMM